MGEKGTTIMELKVDLQCRRCYKKVKKVLCKFPQEIHDQIYDEKKNTVRITVVCCCPEKIMQKIRCKGGNCIMCIKIVPPPPPPTPPPPPKPPCEVPVLVPVCPLVYAIGVCCRECSEGVSGGPCFQGHGQPRPCYVGYGRPVYDSYGTGDCKPPPPPKENPKPPPPPKEDPKPPPPKADPKPPPPKKDPKPHCKVPVVVQVCPPSCVYPPGPSGRVCCRECSLGLSGGPCFEDHGQPPRPCYVGCGQPVYDSYGGGWHRGCYVSRCDYFCEEYSPGCTVM